MSRRAESILLPLVAAMVAIVVWQVAVIVSGTKVFPSPLAVLAGVVELAATGTLLAYLRDSLLRVAAGFTLAALTGVPLGLFMGWYPPLQRAMNPVVQLMRPLSPLAWIPVAIVLFGV